MNTTSKQVSPRDVHEILGRTILADGMPLVLDTQKSRGSILHDALSGQDFVDFFGFFGSLPLGFNHPRMTDPDWVAALGQCAIHKPSNSDVYTTTMAHFVDTFERVALPPEMKHLFFVSGGALAVENAIKVAFDWKSRLNLQQGKDTPGHRVVHLEQAFHGRSGYTLSLTNTDPTKTDLFPQFNWPRVSNPYCTFPLEGDNLAATAAREERSLEEIRTVLEEDAASVAAILIEPIQCEGGDHHFRDEYLAGLRALADEFDVLLVFDEVQTGLGTTGRMWCYQHYSVHPDVVAFGKKTQVCGVMASDRIDRVQDNVFHVSSRINSTWGGNLVDMFRATRILEIFQDEAILDNATARGAQLLDGLEQLQNEFPDQVSNPRGRGLLAAFDLPDTETRNATIQHAYDRGLLVLSCGPRSIRFRPALDIDSQSIERGLALLTEVLANR